MAKSSGLLNPWPSSPTSPPAHCLYIKVKRGGHRDELNDDDRLWVLTFGATYSTRHFLDELIGGYSFEFISDQRMEIGDNKIIVKCSELKQILDYKMNPAEAAWELPTPYPGMIEQIKRGHYADAPTEERVGDRREVAVREKAPKKEKVPRPSKEGLTTISEIAEQMGIDPKDARKALRASNIDKPDVGWAWEPTKIDEIKKLVKKHLK